MAYENPLKAEYGGECPDCFENIPDDVEDGDECVECGHVFWYATDEDVDFDDEEDDDYIW